MNTNIVWSIRGLALATALVGTGCSGHDASSSDGTSAGAAADALFEPPSGTATSDSTYGVWGGSLTDNGMTFDTRMRLSATSATLAARCTIIESGASSRVVGVTVAARISAHEGVDVVPSREKQSRWKPFCCPALHGLICFGVAFTAHRTVPSSVLSDLLSRMTTGRVHEAERRVSRPSRRRSASRA